ncbi:MAG: hypothetical protein ABSH02_17825 [Candidatus Sulfotelmatobacter sp.]|jgi:hypothetical protein
MAHQPQPLNPALSKHLLAYAAMAGAAVTACATAHAEVVYTPVHAKVGYDYPLDLNHDGINDFRIHSYELSGDGSLLVYPLHQGNRIAATLQACYRGSVAAAALSSGAVIGPHKKFLAKASCMIRSFSSTANGPWDFAQDRYLGLVFVIDGKEHFGWARLTNRGFGFDSTDILGYAYETIPGKPIIAGDEGTSASVTRNSGSLGSLALGSAKF